MTVKLLTEQHLEFVSLIGGCTGSSESALVKCHIVGNHMSRLKCVLKAILMSLICLINSNFGTWRSICSDIICSKAPWEVKEVLIHFRFNTKNALNIP